MPTIPERLADFLPANTLLRSPARINRHEPHASFLSFALQYAQEAAPGDITDCPGKPAVSEHPLDVQALDSDQATGKDQSQSRLVVMLAP